jgi:iron complex transport system permease protein
VVGKSQPVKPILILSVTVVVLFLVNISLGSVKIPLDVLFSSFTGKTGNTVWSDILWHFRLPKAVTCILAGASLASGGLMMQTLFRNPLAGPDVLGLSSGASLMVAVVILASRAGTEWLFSLSSNPWSVALAASAGSTLVFLLVIALARRIRDNVSLLIIGLMISATTSALVYVLQFLSRAEDLQAFMIWTLGSVGGTTWYEIQVLASVVVVGSVIAFRSMKSLNAWLLGENYAQSLGINIGRSRFWIVLSTSLLAGSVTAFCGPIAFVGLAVPHLVRLLINTSNHKILLPAVMLGGAALILLCDILSQLPGSTQLLPLNAITSLIGAPFVIWVVMKRKANG